MRQGKKLRPGTAEDHFNDEYYARADGPATEVIAAQGPDVPGDVVHVWEWRESQRLRSVHRRTDSAPPRCEHCRQPWPCTGIKVAELAETRARGGDLPPAWSTWVHGGEGGPRNNRAIGQARPDRPSRDEQ